MTANRPASRLTLPALLASLVMACMLAHAARAATFLIENGQPNADIVIAANPPRTVTIAATELRDNLFKISGATLDIVTTPGSGVSTHIYVGQSAYTDAQGLSNTDLLYDAFQMVSGTNWLTLLGYDADYTPTGPYPSNRNDVTRMMTEWDALTGATWGNPRTGLYKRYSATFGIWEMNKRGSLNAVYAFLRSLGMRWYFPGPIGEVIPQTDTIALPQTNVVVRPDFPVRYMYQYYNQFYMEDTDEILWQLRMGLNSGEEVVGVGALGHGTSFVINRDEMKAAHPDYYALWGGVRQTEGADPCLSIPGLYTQNVAYARATYDINGEPLVSVWPSDGYTALCECSYCVGRSSPERGYYGRLSDYVWDYVNRVATNLYAEYPDRIVLGGAYTAYQLPPTNITALSPNVAIMLCRWRSSFYNPETFDAYTNLVASWFEILPSKQLYIWDYYLHSERTAWAGVPVYFPHVIAKDLRFLKGKSRGDFIEVQRNWDGWGRDWHALAANHLNLYVTSRLYWDADQDVDALLDEYYANFYGPAANEMRAFVEFCETNWPTMRQDKAAMDRTIELLGAARTAAAGTGVYSDRIDLLVGFMQPLFDLRDSLSDHYVAHNGQLPQPPYTNWITAASNIQDTVNIINTNTTIRVGPGRYTLPTNAVDLGGLTVVTIDKPLSLLAASGNPADTIIDGQGAYRGLAIRYPHATTNRFVVDGFTITNCHALNTGGGIALSSGNYGLRILLRNCIVSDNTVAWGDANAYFTTAGSRGGGLGNYEAQPGYFITVSNCVFSRNRAWHGAAGSGNMGQGGAIYLRGGYEPLELVDCRFESNSATSAGGVFNEFANLSAVNCTFRSNRAELLDSGALWYNTTAGGVYAGYGTSSFRNCLAYDNSSEGRAGFLYAPNNKIDLDNCTVVNNSRIGSVGGIFARFDAAELRMRNAIVYDNPGGNWTVNGLIGDSFMTNSCTTPTNGLPGTGNTAADPRFAHAAGANYRLTRNSPCVNTGTNQPWMDGVFDLDGYPRKDPTSGTVDMGCYEFYSGGTLFKYY